MTIFFSGWAGIWRVIVTIVCIYPAIILIMRLYGKRSLSSLNMFDAVISIALGSVLGSTIILENIGIFDGLFTFIMLLAAQYLSTWASVRWDAVDELLKGQPILLFYNGEYLREAMKQVRVTEREILNAVREEGFATLQDIHAIVFETTGDMSIISQSAGDKETGLNNVQNYPGE